MEHVANERMFEVPFGRGRLSFTLPRDEEKKAKLGEDVVRRVSVVNPTPRDATTLVDLGRTADGTPVVLSKLVMDTDLLIATGIVEPHQYAGYSGGRKTVAIGTAGEVTIGYTHGPIFLDHPKTRLGNKVLEQNDVIIVGSQFPDIVREAKMIPAGIMEEAFAIAQDRLGKNLDALIVAHALLTLPVVGGSSR